MLSEKNADSKVYVYDSTFMALWKRQNQKAGKQACGGRG